MVSNVTMGNNFAKLAEYVGEKNLDNGKSAVELLSFYNVAPDYDLKNINGQPTYVPNITSATKDMNNWVKINNTQVKKPVLHTSFSFPRNEILSNQEMEKVIISALKEVGITPDNHQLIMVRHFDRKHPHAHVVINRVNLNGVVHDSSFLANRLQVVCDKVEKMHGLKRTPGRIFVHDPKSEKGYRVQSKKERNVQTKHLTQAISDKKQNREEKEYIQKAFTEVVYSATSLKKLKRGLENKGIDVQVHKNKNGVYGFSFKYNNVAVKASRVGIKAKQAMLQIQENLEREKAENNGIFDNILRPFKNAFSGFGTFKKISSEEETTPEENKSKSSIPSLPLNSPIELRKGKDKKKSPIPEKKSIHSLDTNVHRKPTSTEDIDRALDIYNEIRFGKHTNKFVKDNIELINKLFSNSNSKIDNNGGFLAFKTDYYKEEEIQLQNNYVSFVKEQNDEFARFIEQNNLEKTIIMDFKKSHYNAFSKFMYKALSERNKEYNQLRKMRGMSIHKKQQDEELPDQQKIKRRR